MSGLTALLDDFFSDWWRAHPERATAAGLHLHDGELARHDAGARAELAARLRGWLDRFGRAVPHDVSEEVDLVLVVGQVRWRLYELETVRPHARNPIVYLEPALDALYLMAVREYAPAGERARRAAERMTALPRVLEEARENLTDASPEHVRTAAELARAGLRLLEYVLPVYLGRALEDDAREFARWENALRGAESALVGFARWLERDLAPRAEGDFAIGREAFERRLRDVHGLERDADEIGAFGERLKRETERALAEMAAELRPDADWPDVIAALRDEHPPAAGLIDAYAAEMERARAFVVDRGLATIPADARLDVTPTPEYIRPLIPYAAYFPAAPHEAQQKGVFFVTPPREGHEDAVLRDHSVYGIPVTAVHEAYPGHHLQLSRANRADTEPRRVFSTSLFAEGWALYCEELMWEQGFLADPRQRLLQLQHLLWRACRVVVDVGLHVRGWSAERAVDYMVEEAGLERGSAQVEVGRYCADPTQPLSYAVGKHEILRLRELWRARRGGDAADLRTFHDAVLSWGTIPPALVARGLGLA